jgi:HSF-type DNA-binding
VKANLIKPKPTTCKSERITTQKKAEAKTTTAKIPQTTMINPVLDQEANDPSKYGSDRDDESPMLSSTGAPIVGKAVDPSQFPTQLYKMLEEIDSNSGAAAEQIEGKAFSSLVSWQPHGKCILIHDENMFSQHVLTKYFCRLKFTSFQRQLHFHGFKRLSKQGKPSRNLMDEV